MQRISFRGENFTSSFRSNDPMPGTRVPPVPIPPREFHPLTASSDALPPGQNVCPGIQWTSTPSQRRKKPFRWWQLLFYVPWMLWMFGHDLWRSHHPDPDTALVQSAQDGNVARVESALLQGASVNAECGCKRSALSWTSSKGHIVVASLLLSRGASVNSVDNQGDSALTLAAWQQHADVVALLVAKGADVNHINGKGGTALWSAVQHEQTDMARTLLSHHADPNVPGKRGWTMLMDAARAGSLPMVGMLVAGGARVNARSLDGETAYGVALLHHRRDIAAMLLGAGAVRYQPGARAAR